MDSSNCRNKKRRMEGNEDDSAFPHREIGMRLPVRSTTRKHRHDALTARDTAHLDHLSQTIIACLIIHTHVTLSWFIQTAPLRHAIQSMTLEQAMLENFDSIHDAHGYYFSKIIALFSNAVMQHVYLKSHIYYCMDQIQAMRRIRAIDRPVPNNPARCNRTIASLSVQDAYNWTGFNKEQLSLLLLYLRIPEEFRTRSRYRFTGQEALLMALTHIHTGHDWVVLAQQAYFGGDARRSTELFEWFVDHIYHSFYNAITGSSIGIWSCQIENFRRAIWQSFTEPLINKEEQEVQFDVPFDMWRIALFIDCTTQATCRPGGGANHNVEEVADYVNQVQRAFYTGYTKRHGLKFQILWAPNGMFISVFGSSIRENDNGMINISELNHYLERTLPYTDQTTRQFKVAAYGDAIYNDRSCIVGRAKKKSKDLWRKMLDKQLGRKRSSIENSFADLYNYSGLFANKKKHKLLKQGDKAMKVSIATFFLFNCRSCFNGNSTSRRFGLQPPSLEEYIPLEVDFSQKEDHQQGQDIFWNGDEEIPFVDNEEE